MINDPDIEVRPRSVSDSMELGKRDGSGGGSGGDEWFSTGFN